MMCSVWRPSDRLHVEEGNTMTLPKTWLLKEIQYPNLLYYRGLWVEIVVAFAKSEVDHSEKDCHRRIAVNH